MLLSNEHTKLGKYISKLREFDHSGRILVGNFYSFVYKFDTTQAYNKIKYYDLHPLIFFYDRVGGNSKNIRGVNFHHLPVKIRNIYLNRMIKNAPKQFDENKRLTLLAEWSVLANMYRKASYFSVRQYDPTKMYDIRKIPDDRIDEMLQYYAKTYYGITIDSVQARYMKFITP